MNKTQRQTEIVDKMCGSPNQLVAAIDKLLAQISQDDHETTNNRKPITTTEISDN